MYKYINKYSWSNEIIGCKRYNHKPYFFFPFLVYDPAKKGKVSEAAEIQLDGNKTWTAARGRADVVVREWVKCK
jgi:hypothetical protein